MDRLTQPSRASSILGKRVKPCSVLREQKSRFTGSRIKEHFELKQDERNQLLRKKELLKRSIAQMIFDKQNFLKLSNQINRQKQQIRSRIRQLKEKLGDQLNFPLNAQTIRQIKGAGDSLSKTRREANTQMRAQMRTLREETRNAILADPEYQQESEASLREDTESNMYPANLEFGKLFKTDFEIQFLRNFVSRNLFVFVDSDSCLKVVDWASLRILSLAKVITQKPLLDIVLEAIPEKNEEPNALGGSEKSEDRGTNIFIFTTAEMIQYKYNGDTGKLSLDSKERVAELKETIQIEKHPVEGLVYLVQPEYVVVFCLKSRKVKAKFLVGNGRRRG